jgi:DNA (cytosine-5)-methyltransferase 1
MSNQNKITYIDLFAGAGGLSEGFIREGYLPIAHVEKNKDACSTILTRIAYHWLKEEKRLHEYNAYLRKELTQEELYGKIPHELINTVINSEISDDSIEGIFSIINKNLKQYQKENVDLIVGGPPCQAYSIVGRAMVKNDDPRRFLYRLYIEFLKEYKPKMFVFENVPGILTAKDVEGGGFIEKMQKEFDEAGYTIEYKMLNATDFGVLQDRNRVFILGWQKHLDIKYPQFCKKNDNDSNVSDDILNDLPTLKAGESYKKYEYRTDPSVYLQQSGIRDKQDLLTWHISRPNNENDLEIYKIAIEMWLNESKRLLYPDLPERLIKQKSRKSFLNCFSVVKGNMPFTHTMIAHIAQDGHYYIHPDVKQLRSITVREAARIQAFPDNYFFEGSRTAAFTQIGNAVPPLVAQSIAQKLKDLL